METILSIALMVQFGVIGLIGVGTVLAHAWDEYPASHPFPLRNPPPPMGVNMDREIHTLLKELHASHRGIQAWLDETEVLLQRANRVIYGDLVHGPDPLSLEEALQLYCHNRR